MLIQRLYYNSSDELIRMDEIEIALLPPTPPVVGWTQGNDPGLQMRLGPQTVKTDVYPVSASYATGGRDIASVQVNGSIDDWDKTGSPYDILWATKTLGSGQVVRFNMSNLPKNGDTV